MGERERIDDLRRYGKVLRKGDVQGRRYTAVVEVSVFRRGGDSLMGRYLLYRMHPFSVGESLRTNLPDHEVQPPEEMNAADWEALWEHGGFPEP